MKYIKALLLSLGLLLLALPVQAADGDTVTTTRTGEIDNRSQGWTIHRMIVCDADTGVVTCSKTATPSGRGSSLPPWDRYRIFTDADDSCTSYTVTVRDYPINADTTECNGSCDAHNIVTLTSTGTTSKFLADPLGEAVDADITAIDTCTLSVFIDFFYRNQGR